MVHIVTAWLCRVNVTEIRKSSEWWTLGSHCSDPSSVPGQPMCNLRCTMWHSDRILQNTLVFHTKHNFSNILHSFNHDYPCRSNNKAHYSKLGPQSGIESRPGFFEWLKDKDENVTRKKIKLISLHLTILILWVKDNSLLIVVSLVVTRCDLLKWLSILRSNANNHMQEHL